jgi:hypothetical protein
MNDDANHLREQAARLLSTIAAQRLTTVSIVEALKEIINAIREGNEEYAVQLFKELRLFIQKHASDAKNIERTYGEIERDL